MRIVSRCNFVSHARKQHSHTRARARGFSFPASYDVSALCNALYTRRIERARVCGLSSFPFSKTKRGTARGIPRVSLAREARCVAVGFFFSLSLLFRRAPFVRTRGARFPVSVRPARFTPASRAGGSGSSQLGLSLSLFARLSVRAREQPRYREAVCARLLEIAVLHITTSERSVSRRC